ncbi:MAG: pyridoxal 5'-phosphate synthase glutaminase subunit PdxT [Acidimicrobiaceae bacterium]|nr:pyridoxal 5'-phosphate synthase glutaminase subunit PdxT [Acidimicrobiaceae bacterium]MDE0607597.1 pyridoxal 5'-phosphate synthase glutaminase subunit PdxT [Acidimicrobiaceae bacterium]
MVAPKVGVLALQGAFAAHEAILRTLGCEIRQVRNTRHLVEVDALVVPGGESTTMSNLLARSEMLTMLHAKALGGLPIFGTCAGLILMASEICDGRDDQHALGVLDMAVSRNGYGRQIDSFETDIEVRGLDAPFHAVFIRSPVVTRVGPDVEVLAEVDGNPVLCRKGPVTVTAFHPELSGDDRLHRRWLSQTGILRHSSAQDGRGLGRSRAGAQTE